MSNKNPNIQFLGRHLLQHSQEGRLAHGKDASTRFHRVCYGKKLYLDYKKLIIFKWILIVWLLEFGISLWLFEIVAWRHGPKRTWRDHARIPIWIFQSSHYHWFVGKRNWCTASLPCNQLRSSNQSWKLHSQVRFTLAGLQTGIIQQQYNKIKKHCNNIHFSIAELVVVDDLAEKVLRLTSLPMMTKER